MTGSQRPAVSGRPPLRVLVDLLPVQPDSGGQRVYARRMLERLVEQRDLSLEFVLSRSNREEFATLHPDAKTILPWKTRSVLVRVLTQQLVMPLLALWRRPQVLFEIRDVAPVLAPCPVVTAVLSGHLNYASGMTDQGFVRGLYQRVLGRLTLWRSERIVTISAYVADRIATDFGVPRNRIAVTYLGGGIGEDAVQPGGAARDPGPRDAILFVSSLFPHKNVARLLEAYALLEVRPPLLIVGKDVMGQRARLEAHAAKLGVSATTNFLGRVSDVDLLALYGRAIMLVYPSAVEGFGIPLAEAMWLGVPIVASNRTSVPEVAGGAALIVDPDDVPALARAMRRVLEDAGTREALVRIGLTRRGLFQWRNTAETTANVLLAVGLGEAKRPHRQ